MNILNFFRSRDKPRNRSVGGGWSFLFGGTSSGKATGERTAMQTTRYIGFCTMNRIRR